MNSIARRIIIILIFTVFILPMCNETRGEGNRTDEIGDADYIAIFWTEGDHAEYLEELSDYYTMETEVFVFVDTVPESDFQAITFTELGAHSEAFDIIVGEPEWLEEGVSSGHYAELTGWVEDLGADRSIEDEVFSATGEYPAGSGRYWAVPVFMGQGASVVAYSQKHELALDWLEWFVRPDTQAMWKE